jgi:hypothetical protein
MRTRCSVRKPGFGDDECVVKSPRAPAARATAGRVAEGVARCYTRGPNCRRQAAEQSDDEADDDCEPEHRAVDANSSDAADRFGQHIGDGARRAKRDRDAERARYHGDERTLG